jgi:plastocyanin
MRVVLVVLLLGVVSSTAVGQSALERGPNLTGTWTVSPGVLQFNFIHRFRVGPAPAHKVTNSPTFVFAAGPVDWLTLAARYASNSLTTGEGAKPNEFEGLVKWRLFGGPGRGPLTVAAIPAYNFTTKSADGELAVDYTTRALTLSAAGRALASPYDIDAARFAVAGGAAFRLNDYVAIVADVAALTERVSPSVPNVAAWGAGLQFAIPGSGHTVSLHATNSGVNTLEGASLGSSDVLYGFEFTIPIRLARFAPLFSGRRSSERTDASGSAAATIEIRDLRFPSDTTTVRVGEAVRWVNLDPVEHTVTFDDGGMTSPLFGLRGAYRQVFDRPGVYPYHCTPHPFMRGVVKVVP